MSEMTAGEAPQELSRRRGRFGDARNAAERAQAGALRASHASLAADIERRLALYRRGIPNVERRGGGPARAAGVESASQRRKRSKSEKSDP